MSTTSPSGLARRVHKVLAGRTAGSPGVDVLESLFTVMFGASLQREEQQPIVFHTVYLDPANPDPDPPQLVRENRWTLARLGSPLPLSVADRGVLVGAASMGPTGGEVLSMLSVAVHAMVPTSTLREMIYAYPTSQRGIEDALADLGA